MNISKPVSRLIVSSLALSLLLSTSVNAATLNWEKKYGGQIHGKSGMSLEESNYFGTFLTAPWNDLLTQYSTAGILLTANPGAPIKANNFKSYSLKTNGLIKSSIPTNATAMVETTDKNIVAVKAGGTFKVHTFTLVKYKSNSFARMWSTQIKPTNAKHSLVEISTLAQVTDGGFVVGGTEFVPGDDWGTQAVLWKFDSKGQLVWSKVVGALGKKSEINTIKATTDGGVIVAGHQSNAQNADSAWIRTVTVNGEKVWEKTYGCSESVADVMVTAEGNVVVASNVRTTYSTNPASWNTETMRTFWSTRLNVLNSANGEFIDERIIQGAFPTDTIADLCNSAQVVAENFVPDPTSFKTSSLMSTNDGGYLLVGTKSSTFAPIQPAFNHVWVRKLSTELNLVSEHVFKSKDSEYGANAIQLSTGQYLVAGLKQSGQRIVRMITE